MLIIVMLEKKKGESMKSRVYEPYLCKNLHVVQAFISCKEVVVRNKAVRAVDVHNVSRSREFCGVLLKTSS